MNSDQGTVLRGRSSDRGFTLIELMITLVIISVIVGMASLSIYQNPAKDIEREAARLQMVLQHVADEAILQGSEFALAFPSGAYQFLSFNSTDRLWIPMVGKEYSKYTLPENVTLTLEIDGEAVDDEVKKQALMLQKASDKQELQPSLLLLSSGEITPFTISFHHSAISETSKLSSDGVSGIYIQ